ncbi:MAG: EscU/YscU/HrcU family type III secretion system export apparatus switch protein, partial [Candidatus Eremiobacteraeota bacterium]|nr:EscU/YscU/HrcU family type III secretion system export apparatus switch protein [Candidatus Eremiobacteraeota bacterium]
MSDESAEKHYDPTPSRLERAKREGNVARSQDAVMVAAFGAAIVATLAVVPGLSSAAAVTFRDAAAQHIALNTYAQLAVLASSPIAAAAVAAIACASLQSGGVAFVAPSPKFERLAPAGGFKRMVSRETAVTALRASCA